MRWAGSKRQLVKQLRDIFPIGYFNKYYEPFIGAGAMLLDICPQQAVIGDLNRDLINVWSSIKENCSELISELEILESENCDKTRYYEVREQYNTTDEYNVQKAAMFLYLIRHCFNGLYRVNKQRAFNTSWNKEIDSMTVDNTLFQEVSQLLQLYDIRCGDYQVTCYDIQPGDFVYFDPPYSPAVKHGFTRYTKENFGYKEQQRLADYCKYLTHRRVFVVVSNNDTEEVRRLYRDFWITSIPVKRMINRDSSNRIGKEVIITNYQTNI